MRAPIADVSQYSELSLPWTFSNVLHTHTMKKATLQVNYIVMSSCNVSAGGTTMSLMMIGALSILRRFDMNCFVIKWRHEVTPPRRLRYKFTALLQCSPSGLACQCSLAVRRQYRGYCLCRHSGYPQHQIVQTEYHDNEGNIDCGSSSACSDAFRRYPRRPYLPSLPVPWATFCRVCLCIFLILSSLFYCMLLYMMFVFVFLYILEWNC